MALATCIPTNMTLITPYLPSPPCTPSPLLVPLNPPLSRSFGPLTFHFHIVSKLDTITQKHGLLGSKFAEAFLWAEIVNIANNLEFNMKGSGINAIHEYLFIFKIIIAARSTAGLPGRYFAVLYTYRTVIIKD